jgi:DNA primase
MGDFSLSNSELNDILAKVDIVKIIGSYISLTQKGRNFLGLCPFHNDTNPSMSVSPEKRIYKCFVCGAGGNAFTFVMDYEKVPFLKAVKTVCDISGIEVPKLNKLASETKNIKDDEKRQYLLLDAIQTYYAFQLKVSAGEQALNYLKNRHINEEIIKRFQIGFSLPDGKLLVNYLTSKGFTIDEILKSGIATYLNGEAFDMMRGRVTFAIKDHDAQIVAFSGRRFDEIKEQKYINSQETTVFHKSKILYNFAEASSSARKNGFIFIVEGFMDVIALYKAGIENVVATMGTAITSEHVMELLNLRAELRLLFDNDRAGKVATLRALDIIENSKVKAKIVRPFKQAKDSDEFLNKQGADKLVEAINDLIEPFDYRLDFLKENLNLENHEDRKKFVNDAIKHLITLRPSTYDLDYYIRKISEISGFSRQLVQKTYQNSTNLVDKPQFVSRFQKNNQIVHINRYEKAQRQIIHKMLENPLVISQFQAADVYMYDEVYRRLCAYIIDDYNRNGTVNFDYIMTQISPDLRKFLIEITEEIIEPVDIENLFDTLKLGKTGEMEITTLREKMLQTSDPVIQAKIATEMLKNKLVLEKQTKERIEKDRGGKNK